jgi:acetylornithine deacetylase/succinyl-diaminopimelate desuccinylase-like protein
VSVPESPEANTEQSVGKELMSVMIENSQLPGQGNRNFVRSVTEATEGMNFTTRTIGDPQYNDKSLLVLEIGDPDGEQTLAAISHSDVVGVKGQAWDHDPWKLHESDDSWFGRGACDTHGSGVSMILAATRPEVREALERSNKKLSIIFTYDEEATSPELSMRGARLAAGLLGKEAVVASDYFIAGEPTEYEDHIVAMRAHKGRWLAHFTVDVEHSGHVSETVQNAFMVGASIVHSIGDHVRMMSVGNISEADYIFKPPHSTIQVSAAEVKSGDYSTTPEKARFTIDMRTMPDTHRLMVRELTDLIIGQGVQWEAGTRVSLELIKEAEGSTTDESSAIVAMAQEVIGFPARGFNGGDEGRILRLLAGKEGVTLGPGKLGYAHMPNERVAIQSVLEAADIYSKMFMASVELPSQKL